MNDVRLDSIGSDQRIQATAYGDAEALSEWRIRENARAIYEASRRLVRHDGRAYDSVGSDRALFLARELEYLHSTVLEDVYEDLNAERLIPTDSSVPAGARTHTIRRESKSGEMVWFRGNSSDRGQTAIQREEKEYKIHAAITSVKLNFFDEMRADFAGYSLEQKLKQAAERVAAEFKNEKIWEGDDDRGVPGMFNSPFGPKTTSGVTFGPGGGTAAAQLEELHRLANLIGEETNDKFYPTALAAPIKYINHWKNTHLDTANSSNQSILEAFMEKNDYVNQVVKCRECSNQGSADDILQMFRPNDSQSAHAVIPQGLTWMPMERTGFEMEMDAYLLFGGVNQYKPLNNLTVYASYSA